MLSIIKDADTVDFLQARTRESNSEQVYLGTTLVSVSIGFLINKPPPCVFIKRSSQLMEKVNRADKQKESSGAGNGVRILELKAKRADSRRLVSKF